MDIFSRSKLIKSNNGYTLVLYVDKHTGEFAEEFFSRLGTKRKVLQRDALDYIKGYVDENYKGIKIDTVNIMVGSLLVASIAYAPFSAASSLLPARHSGLKANAPYAGKSLENKAAKRDELLYKLRSLIDNTMYPRKQLKVQEQEDVQASSPPAAGTESILLVNKTHSLPEGYVPENLTAPNVSKVNSAKTMMAPEAAKALEDLFKKAKQDGIQLYAISGYRSYELQASIFTSNTRKYGSAAAANQFSARPGQSEHQTGLAMDVSSPSVNFKLTQSFADTREGKWLKENAAQFGFIIRYPKGKEDITGYQFEPWHIRYVGEAAALEVTSRDITLEEFLEEG